LWTSRPAQRSETICRGLLAFTRNEVGTTKREAGHGIPSEDHILPYVLPTREQQTLVLAGIRIILLVRLRALVSNRASRVGPTHLPVYLFSWALVRASA
jgi:hypothetical protein